MNWKNRSLELLGFKPLDALHLAAAEAGQADYFCTSDDKLLKRGRAVAELQIILVLPVELIEELNR